MEKKKQMIIMFIAMILLIGFLIGGFLIVRNKGNNKNNDIKEEFDNKVVSTITLDINPSIKIELNKDKKVVNIVSLNDDGKEIIEGNYVGRELKEVVNGITDKLIDKGYAKEELVILVGVSGEVKGEDVKVIIGNKLDEEKVGYDIIIPEISDSSIELAKKYNITESKAAYLEETIRKYPDFKIEDIKDMSIGDIIDKTEEVSKNTEEENKKENTGTGTSGGNSGSGGYGTLEKCDYVYSALTNEEAGKKVASMMGASVGTGKYCDKLAPESVIVLSSDGTCAYKVTFAYRTQSCVYYIGVETGNVIGSPSCTSKLVEEGEAQCIVMESMGITKRENSGIVKNIDGGSEWVYEVEDMYGAPDENGKSYVYEYHVSKYTGQITSKTVIRELQ